MCIKLKTLALRVWVHATIMFVVLLVTNNNGTLFTLSKRLTGVL